LFRKGQFTLSDLSCDMSRQKSDGFSCNCQICLVIFCLLHFLFTLSCDMYYSNQLKASLHYLILSCDMSRQKSDGFSCNCQICLVVFCLLHFLFTLSCDMYYANQLTEIRKPSKKHNKSKIELE